MAQVSDERRIHDRIEVSLVVTCRRLGTRATVQQEVHALDLSPGGMQLHAPGSEFEAGDVMMLNLDAGGVTLSLKGLVVATRPAIEGVGRYVHVAFTGVSDAARDGLITILDIHADA